MNNEKYYGLKERIYENCKLNEMTGCLEWIKYKNSKGYGTIRWKHEAIMTHRASWLVNKGEIDPGKLVLHSCNNPPCILIDHLYLGTAKENSEYMVSLGRHKKPYSKKTEVLERFRATIKADQVREIIEMIKNGISSRLISKNLNISIHIINDVRSGKTWNHIRRPEDIWPRGSRKKERIKNNCLKCGKEMVMLASQMNKYCSFKCKLKIDEPTAIEIKKKLRDGTSLNKLAKQFNVDEKVIFNIKHGYTWSHVTLTD